MATTTVQAPTAREAQRAADRLAAVGVGRVLLFGSTARDRATAGSDIDLVAILDDIDYRERHRIRSALCEAAESVVASPVEVFVTDRAEWRRRTEEVSASFEAGIASSVVVLVDRPAGAVRWDKEIGLPDNNTDEALGRLDESSKALTTMTRSMRADDWELLEPEDDHMTLWRLVDVCSAGAMATETALKALAAAHGAPAPHKHRIDLLVPLVGRRTEDVRTALADLEADTVARGDAPYGDLSIWRGAGTYIADRPDIDLDAVAAMAPRVAQAAIAVAAIAADELDGLAPGVAEVTRARRILHLADDTLASYDLRTGARVRHSWDTGGRRA
ncbi:MAG: nucleotidyltransferase domain-containing protein [Acidimicrobiaceae bacterium]|nr:nucleotidyltransferase domain-containing protein [Acidimicrobiaceae bacterium]